jgi:triphosphoribosyl-dephospho-CoA synthase
MSLPRHGAGMIAAAAQTACLLEVQAPKPGNVSRGRDLPGLTYRDLVLSAHAVGPAFARGAGGRMGRMVLEAVRATRRHVGTNTNLGMILLLAPLARAALARRGPFRERLRRVLADLDRRDARDVYRAIRLAGAGGLGRVGEQDVRSEPTAPLLDCMRLAVGRDAIAREYATCFETTLGLGFPTLRRLRERHVPLPEAIAQTYLTLLAAIPDTLIARRHGPAAARRVGRMARRALEAGGFLTARGRAEAERVDGRLRASRPPLNPGATADLTVASLFVWLLDDLGWTGSIGEAPAKPSVRPTRARRRGSRRAWRTRSRRGTPPAPRPGASAPPPRSRRKRTRPAPRTTARRRARRLPSGGR